LPSSGQGVLSVELDVNGMKERTKLNNVWLVEKLCTNLFSVRSTLQRRPTWSFKENISSVGIHDASGALKVQADYDIVSGLCKVRLQVLKPGGPMTGCAKRVAVSNAKHSEVQRSVGQGKGASSKVEPSRAPSGKRSYAEVVAQPHKKKEKLSFGKTVLFSKRVGSVNLPCNSVFDRTRYGRGLNRERGGGGQNGRVGNRGG